MTQKSRNHLRASTLLLSATLAIPATFSVVLSGCGESREDILNRQIAYENAGKPKGNPADAIPKIPPHPTRDALVPLLSAIYSGQRMPDVMEAELEGSDPSANYELSAGVLSVVRLKPGLSEDQKVRAIVTATAEADAWVHRANARRNYADHIHRIMRGFGDDQKHAVLHAYGELKLLDFFNSEGAAAAVAKLPANLQGTINAMQKEYSAGKDKIWDRWMAVKMFARREVAGDEPFRSVLSNIRKALGHREPTPITWAAAHDAPFQAWADEINKNQELFTILSNLKEFREQEELRSDTHTMWVMQGSPKTPAKAKNVKIEKDLGFGVHREDLGGGYQEMTFVFSKKLKGNDLKRAYLRSHIYRHLFSDFQMLATAGSDYKESQVPDKYDPEYARCGSEAAMDAFVASYGSKFPILAGVKTGLKDEEKIIERSVKCLVERCSPEIKVPDPNDDTDVEGPAPGSRLGIFQMLARFQSVDVDLNAMRKEPPKSQAVLDAEAFLKANPNQHQ